MENKITNWCIYHPKDNEVIEYLRKLNHIYGTRLNCTGECYYSLFNNELIASIILPKNCKILTEQEFKEKVMNIKKELPKYFIVRRHSSPLWNKYINWLNKTYNVAWSGTGYTYYGFNGAVGETGTDAFDNINAFKNNPTLLTLEEWDSIVNPKKETYTIEQIKEQRIAVVCYSKEEGQKLCKALHPNPFLHDFQNTLKFEVFLDGNSLQWEFCDPNFKYFEKERKYGNKASKTIEFNQVIFENMEQKEEIIGYLAPCDLFGGNPETVKGTIFIKPGTDYHWYLPEKEFKRYKTSQQGSYHMPKEIVETWEPVYKPKYELPKINNYPGKIEGEYIIYGSNCAKFHKSFFTDLYKATNKDYYGKEQNRTLKSFKLNSGIEITSEQLEQIFLFINNN